MRRVMGVVVLAVVMLTGCAGLQKPDRVVSCFEVMEGIQERITWQVWNANGWAASPAVVEAVLTQNQKGPIAGMDNAKWKAVPKSDAIVQAFINNDVGQFLKTEIAKTEGVCIRAFLNAAQGEKVAFTDKPGSYIHKGAPNFDAPFASGKAWQGKPELENKNYVIQIAVPVLSEGKPIGTLAVDINGTKLEELSKQ